MVARDGGPAGGRGEGRAAFFHAGAFGVVGGTMLGQVIVSGLAMGCIYALIALGYAYVWNTMAIVNFAAGEFLTFAAYVFVASFTMSMGLPFWLAAILTCLFMAALGALFSMLVFARLQKQKSLVAIIATVGFGIFLRELARIIYGPQPILYDSPIRRRGSGTCRPLHAGTAGRGHLHRARHHDRPVSAAPLLDDRQGHACHRSRPRDGGPDGYSGRPGPCRRVRLLLGACSTRRHTARAAFLRYDGHGHAGRPQGLRGDDHRRLRQRAGRDRRRRTAWCFVENVGAFEISSSYKDAIAFGVLLIFLLLRPQGLLPERDADRA